MLATIVTSAFSNILAQDISLAFDETAGKGISIAVTGMLIVMLALSIISLFIAILPRFLGAFAKVYPEPVERHSKRSHPESLIADDEAVLAAIGFVLHTEFQKNVIGDKTTKNE